MTLKKALLSAAVAAMVSTSAHAFYFPTGDGGVIAGAAAEDDNLDWFIDNDGNQTISVGDRLVAVLEFTQILDIYAGNGTNPAQILNTGLDELVAISDVTVTSVVGGRVELGATAGVSAVRVFSLGSSINLDLGTFSNCTSLATCSAAVTDGNPWAEFSFVDPDDQWFFNDALGGAGLLPGVIAGLPAVTKVGTVNFALSLVAGTNNSGYDFLDQAIACAPGILFDCAGDGLTTLLGSSDVLGGAGLPAGLGAFARTDTDVSVNVVPEPASLALIGMGLLGLGAARRKKVA